MNEERTLLVGIDLCNDYTQISCCDKKSGQPDSLGISADKNKYRIPTALVAKKSTREWLIGDDAVEYARINADMDTLCLVDNLVDSASKGLGVTVFERAYSPETLLVKFFKRVLNILRQKYFNEGIKALVVTIERFDERVEKAIRSALAELGIEDDRLRIITHLESFMYYTVSQSNEIWINDVGLFDYTADGLFFYRLSFGRKQIPIVVAAEKTDLSSELSFEMLSELPTDKLAYSFDNISGSMLHKQIISAIFVTGPGFETTWADDVLKGLCVGRRIFRGQNLFTKGAAYAAWHMFESDSPKFMMLDDDMLKNTIALRIYHDAQLQDIVMARVGEHWQTAGGEVRLLLDNTNEIDIIVKNVMRRDPVCAILTLDSPGNVSEKNIELKLEISFKDRDTAVITARDMGFGEFRKCSFRIWEQILKL